jgi:uncharacterized protein (DUF697 family)
MIKQARAAVSLLNPEEVRSRARRPVHVGLVAADGAGYAELEDFLLPAGLPRNLRLNMMERVHRAGDPDVPDAVDVVLYQHGIPHNQDAYTFDRRDPESTVSQIVQDHEDLALALARQFPAFRKPIVEGTIHAVATENALFAIATALPNVVPNLLELPWVFGEFASDTAFLTANQIRMAFLISAACGGDPGFAQQRAEILSIVGGAFGFRALARELAGHIPLGGGLIPKGAIAYAGTYAVGKSLEYYHHGNRHYTDEQRAEVYRHGLKRGKDVVGQVANLRPIVNRPSKLP